MNDANTTQSAPATVPQTHAETIPAPLFPSLGATPKPTQEPRSEVPAPSADDIEGWIQFLRANPHKGAPSTIALSRLDENTGRYDTLPPVISADTFTTALLLKRSGPGTYRAVIRSAEGQAMKHVTFSLASGDEPASAGVIKAQPAAVQAQQPVVINPLEMMKMLNEASERAEERAEQRFERMLKLMQSSNNAGARNAPEDPLAAMQRALDFTKQLKSEILEEVRPSKGGSEWVEVARVAIEEFGPGLKAIAARAAMRPQANAAAATSRGAQAQRSTRRVRPGSTNTTLGGASGAGALQSASAGGGGSESTAPQSVEGAQAPSAPPTSSAATQPTDAAQTELQRLQAIIAIYLPMIAASAAIGGNVATVGEVLLDGVEAEGIFDFVQELVPSVPECGLVNMLLAVAGPKGPELEKHRAWLGDLEKHLRAACAPDEEAAQ